MFLALAVRGFGQIPAGYYDGTEGLTGEALRAALSEIISDHTELTYNSLWTHFQATDRKPDGKVWDMYSDVPGGTPAYTYTFVVDQCGNYGAEGDCYNREHSFPKSWFNDAPPMVTDLFQIYPTDGYVNGMRSNYPYGETNTATWTSTNGSKLGICSFTGYNGVIFEPIDEYKGDFARTYFYMVTCYLDRVSSWSSPMLSGDNFSSWAKQILLEWGIDDPVSDKETDRNEQVYNVQGNRNPFIDHPEWAWDIWGTPSELPEPGTDRLAVWASGGLLYIRQEYEMPGVARLYSLTGQEVVRFPMTDISEELPLAVPAGIYVFSFTHSEGIEKRKLFVRE